MPSVGLRLRLGQPIRRFLYNPLELVHYALDHALRRNYRTEARRLQLVVQAEPPPALAQPAACLRNRLGARLGIGLLVREGREGAAPAREAGVAGGGGGGEGEVVRLALALMQEQAEEEEGEVRQPEGAKGVASV